MSSGELNYQPTLSFLAGLGLKDENAFRCLDKRSKLRQVVAYLELISNEIKKFSQKRKLIFIECAAGNPLLSLALNHHFTRIASRDAEFHCIDQNSKLMLQAEHRAQRLGFSNMHFHATDIANFKAVTRADVVYSLHACNDATDKTLHLACKLRAKRVFSIACCQHDIVRNFKAQSLKGLSGIGIFKERLAYMVADAMRAQLMATQGYDVDIFEYISSRFTDKNTILRARYSGLFKKDLEAYESLREMFRIEPELKCYLAGENSFSMARGCRNSGCCFL